MMVEGNRVHHLSVVPYLGKILICGLRGIKCQIQVFGHFLGNWSLKVSNFWHDGRGKYGASFECSFIFRKNINPGIKVD